MPTIRTPIAFPIGSSDLREIREFASDDVVGVAHGGTGATTASAAQVNLGLDEAFVVGKLATAQSAGEDAHVFTTAFKNKLEGIEAAAVAQRDDAAKLISAIGYDSGQDGWDTSDPGEGIGVERTLAQAELPANLMMGGGTLRARIVGSFTSNNDPLRSSCLIVYLKDGSDTTLVTLTNSSVTPSQASDNVEYVFIVNMIIDFFGDGELLCEGSFKMREAAQADSGATGINRETDIALNGGMNWIELDFFKVSSIDWTVDQTLKLNVLGQSTSGDSYHVHKVSMILDNPFDGVL